MIKESILIICFIIIPLINNSMFKEETNMMKKVEKKELISFSVRTEDTVKANDKEIKIILSLKNISKEKIYISSPYCLNMDVIPFLVNKTGEQLPFQFVLKSNCKNNFIAISPSEIHIEEFKYNLEECFDISKPGKYKLYFKHIGLTPTKTRKKYQETKN